MQMKRSIMRQSIITAFVLTLGFCGAGYAAAPAIPSATDSSLSPAQTAQLKAYVQYWIDRLKVNTSHSGMTHDANQLLKPLKTPSQQPSAVFSYDYGSIVSRAVRPLLKDPDRQLIAAVVLGRINDLSAQSSLELALQNQNAGVRYWGAEGLIRILPELQSIPPAYQEAENHLVSAIKVEDSPLVAAKIATALSQFSPTPTGVVSSLNRVLAAQAKLFSRRPPNSVAQAGILAQAITTVIRAQAHLSTSEKTAAATDLTQLLSYT